MFLILKMPVIMSEDGPTKRKKLNTNVKPTGKVMIVRSHEFEKLYFLFMYSYDY